MTYRNFLIGQIKKTLDRDDLTAIETIRLLKLLGKYVRTPSRKPAKAPRAPKPAVLKTPFQRPNE
jgi:hypothetical protein